jgi:elongation factor Ts
LQVAAMSPTYISFEDVPADQREKLLAEFKEEMKDSGKPANIIDQIVEGKFKKSLADVVLMEQEYIRDGSKKIKDILPSDFKCTGFLRMSI